VFENVKMLLSAFKMPKNAVVDIVHTVGPQGEFADELESCYQTCIQRMSENSLKSIVRPAAFYCICTVKLN